MRRYKLFPRIHQFLSISEVKIVNINMTYTKYVIHHKKGSYMSDVWQPVFKMCGLLMQLITYCFSSICALYAFVNRFLRVLIEFRLILLNITISSNMISSATASKCPQNQVKKLIIKVFVKRFFLLHNILEIICLSIGLVCVIKSSCFCCLFLTPLFVHLFHDIP